MRPLPSNFWRAFSKYIELKSTLRLVLCRSSLPLATSTHPRLHNRDHRMVQYHRLVHNVILDY